MNSPLPVSWQVCGSQFGHTAPPCLLPRPQWYQSPPQDVHWAPQVKMGIRLRMFNTVGDMCYRYTFKKSSYGSDCKGKKRLFSRILFQVCSYFRPSSLRNCTAEACALQWLVGPWTQCTATCGRHGFQSRQVTCIHLRTSKAFRDRHCTWRPRPASWQRCNILSCGRGEKKLQ